MTSKTNVIQGNRLENQLKCRNIFAYVKIYKSAKLKQISFHVDLSIVYIIYASVKKFIALMKLCALLK